MDKVIKLEKKHCEEIPYSDFLECYKNQVYQICFFMIGKQNEAEEIAQTAFKEMYINVRDDNFGKASSKLLRITVDLVLGWLLESRTNDYTEIELDEFTESIQKEILQLEVYDRLAIVLKHIVGFSVQEISDIMQLPISNVRKRIHCSREVLCKQLNYKI